MNELTKKEQNDLQILTDHPIADLVKPLQTRILLFDSFIAGTSHVKDKSVFDTLKPGDRLSMVREDNIEDPNAILLLDRQKRKYGYIPAKDNVVFSRLMDAGKMLETEVKSIEQRGHFWKIEIGIYLIDF